MISILLDIDGVMVPANSWRKLEFLEDDFPKFSPRAVSSLNKIINHFNKVEIILITSHKHRYTPQQWKEIFRLRNINDVPIKRLPANTKGLNRREEIIEWLSQNTNFENFIIIDDDKSLNSLPAPIKNKLVQTSASVGLNDQLAEVAIGRVKKYNEPS